LAVFEELVPVPVEVLVLVPVEELEPTVQTVS
jgi:hypothetical protein